MTTHRRSAVLTIALLGLWATEAHAYLDANSGSMLLQLLLGGVAGVVVLVKIYWRRLTAGLGLRRREPAPPTGDPAQR